MARPSNGFDRNRIFALVFLALLMGLLYLLALIFKPFLMPILWAIILVRVSYPIYRWVLVHLHGRANSAAAIMTMAVLMLAVAPAAYFVFALVQESMAAYENVDRWLQAGGLTQAAEYISTFPLIGAHSQEWLGRLIVHREEFEASIMTGGRVVSGFLLAQAADVAKNAFLIATDFLVMLFTLFFLFRDGQHLFDRLYRAVPLNPDHKAKLFERMRTTIVAVVSGTLLTAMAQGLVSGLVFWLLDVPFPVFLGALSALLSLLPFGGTFFVWGPVAVYLFATAPVWKGAVMIAVGGGLVGLMDNVLQPYLIGSGASLPVLALFFASVGGLAYFGFIGLFLGPILLAIAMAAFQIYEEEYQGAVPLPIPIKKADSYSEVE
jgi:predicted PurR-regulated permease PerM